MAIEGVKNLGAAAVSAIRQNFNSAHAAGFPDSLQTQAAQFVRGPNQGIQASARLNSLDAKTRADIGDRVAIFARQAVGELSSYVS
jgi:hypothetical protein